MIIVLATARQRSGRYWRISARLQRAAEQRPPTSKAENEMILLHLGVALAIACVVTFAAVVGAMTLVAKEAHRKRKKMSQSLP